MFGKSLNTLRTGLLAALWGLTALLPAYAVDWNHNPDDLDLGPTVWGDLDPSFSTCNTGQAQSPVDIDDTRRRGLPPLRVRYRETPFVIENDGHTLEVPYELGSRLRVAGQRFRLLQFHLHTPSEHTFDGGHLAMEAHLVHMSPEGQIAVVAVFFRLGDPNPVIEAILRHAPLEEGEVDVEGKTINAEDLLPRRRQYIALNGSLTTPPCSEGVRWFLLTQPLEVSEEQVERFEEFIAEFSAYDGYPFNNRPTQPLNGRLPLERAGRGNR